MSDKLNIHKLSRKIDFWTFLERAFEKNVKIDIGHFKIISIFLDVMEFYESLSKDISKKEARKTLEKEGIFSKNSEYISGEYLKNHIDRDSRVAVHNRINDLRKLEFVIETKPGPLGGYKLLKTPKWFLSENS
ncbi:Helix-turn-helix type 11 domain protein [Methanococcus vannielii SB]|jgi:biotin operon repressor|uniref:Helix-turn-helix type 11 domain protein n=1 Tax=Methanococcus vannielii (strain ATCC 35089 / DSM 1224 / JCM 13029 / OCM 148 / SB) TaxID=406327 RepID=A6UQB2_METVS|nr:HTH domain-containing protein [Methanococcus vannielii]ABR54684.1 Helix-turn-helix type 11 domain protein [Methanococcus vannielii SB]